MHRAWSIGLIAALCFPPSTLGCKAQAPTPLPELLAKPQASGPAVPDAGLALVVRKTERVLTVVNDGVPIHEFPVVMGPAAHGPKRFEGDLRTPEGLYRVTGKRQHPRWRYFIAFDYPNDEDVAAYAAAIANGDVPLVNGEFAGLGGAVGIHGSDHAEDQAEGRDWTRGCVAMSSDDVEVVYDMVDPGTPIVILP